MNYPAVKLYLEIVKLIVVTLVLITILKRHYVFTTLLPRRFLKRAVLFLIIFWAGFVADVSNDIYPTPFTKILDDIIISMALILGAYFVWSASKTPTVHVTPVTVKNGTPKVEPGAYTIPPHKLDEVLRVLSGRRVLFITRNPEKLKEWGIPYIWVTKIPAKEGIDPRNLHVLLHEISNKLDEETAVIIDAVEYLIIENDFRSVMKFLTTLKDIALQKNATLLVSLDKNALEKREIALITEEFQWIEI